MYSFDPNVNTQSHFVILKTPLMWPPCYYDQDFMAQWWLYLWGSTVISLSNNNNIRQNDEWEKEVEDLENCRRS